MADAARHASQRVATTVRAPLALALMAASGFAGLGCQIVWTQWSALWLGHEAAAVLAVVAAFFGGLAVGALMLGDRIERSDRPVRWYAACEAVVGLWGVVLIVAMAPVSDRLLSLTGAQPAPAWQWGIAFAGTFVLLLPATAAMGATLPAIERAASRLHGSGRSIAGLYAANTFGAVLGVLAAAFWLVPAIGLARTAGVCVALNLTCAVLALRWLDDRGAARATPPPKAPVPGLRIRLAMTGLLGIGYEVLVVRVLGQVSEDTVYTFALLLAVYLIGSALGAAAYQRWFARDDDARRRLDPRVADRLLVVLAIACLVGTGGLWFAESQKALLMKLLGDGMAAALIAEATLAVAAFALPTVVMGALFGHLCACANASGIGFGKALGINIVGAAAAPGVFGVLLAPALGPKGALLVVVAGYLALTSRRVWPRPVIWTSAAAVLVLAVAAPPLAFVDLPDGARLVSYADGVTAAVSVVEDAEGVSRLRIDNRQQEGSSATRFVDGRQALLPLLLHRGSGPPPLHALFLGLGTGITASTGADDPAVEVDAVELLPEVVVASRHFTRAFDDGVPNPRLHLLVADARRYVRTTSRTYDVIVADNFHPARGGSGALYTVEHFAAVRDRLADGGLFCQWLPLHQLDLETLRSIVRSFMAAYPHGWAMLASNSLGTPTVGLVGNRDGARFDVDASRERLDRAAVPGGAAAFGIDDSFALFGGFVAGPDALLRFAGDAPPNTDDHPVVAYRAPRVTYAPRSSPQDRLIALLREMSISPSVLIDRPDDDAFTVRLAAYWTARNRYLALGRGVRPSSDVRMMLAQIGDPLLAIVRGSPDFRPAYDPLLRMAVELGRSDPAASRAWLTALVEAQPGRGEAGEMLRRMGR